MSSAAPHPSLIQALRTETATLHIALEKRLPFFSERLDLALYRRLMAAYYGFYQPLEQRLHVLALIPTGLDQSLRVKLPVLRADLTALGLDDAAIDALPTCQALPRIDSRATPARRECRPARRQPAPIRHTTATPDESDSQRCETSR